MQGSKRVRDYLDTAQRDAGAYKEKLEKLFQPHHERIPTHKQQDLRDSFDDALTYLQLIEMAIETGYLPQEDVADLAEAEFRSLFWSKSARGFVTTYDYTQVKALAARYHIKGFGGGSAGAIDETGAMHFASFLATQREIENDVPSETWLRFLDDYVIRRYEKDEFYDFLVSGKPARSERRVVLLVGARSFCVRLADFLAALPAPLQPRFGSFHAYWLAKMFGYELDGRRYVREDEVWDEGESWAQALLFWHKRRIERNEGDVSADDLELMTRSLRVLEETWGRLHKPAR
jgi:hypothetical protein